MSTKPSELVARELKRAEILSTALRTHSPAVSPVLDQQAATVTREGETTPQAALEQERKARLLDEASVNLNKAGEDRRDAVVDRVNVGKERDTWYHMTKTEMFSLQTFLRGRCGRDYLSAIGFGVPLASTPEKLQLQGQHVVKRLKKVPLKLKAGASPVDAVEEASKIEPLVDELELRNSLYNEAERIASESLSTKDEAYEHLQKLNTTISLETFATYRRAGFDTLATRLQRRLTSIMQPSSSAGSSSNGQGTDAPPSDGTPDPDPPSPPDDGSVTEAPDGSPPDGTASA